jgi:inorganic pyrophosphatase/exopolyphosphatase
LNSTAKEDNHERKLNRDRAIKAVKQSYKGFVGMAVANLFSENNRERLVEEIEMVKRSFKTPLQAIVASLEGMKIRKDRSLLFLQGSYPKC